MNTLRKIRVMEVIGSLHIGGAENVVRNLANGIDRSQFELAVRCTRELGVIAERLSADGIDVQLARPRHRRWRHFTPLTLWRAIRQWQPDIVHSHGTVAMLHTGPLAAVGLARRWVHTFHFGNYDAGLTHDMKIERRLWQSAAELVAVSDTQRESLIKHYGVPGERIRTVLNGVAANPIAHDPQARLRKRAELGMAPDDVVVGCVAVLSEQKGISFLLQAAPSILAAHPRVRLFIVGGGPLESELRRQATALGGGDRIVFTGWRQDGIDILAALDIFVMSSLWEAMPMVLLEAMAAARPIVATDVGENARVLDSGRCGRLVPARSGEALASAVSSLIDHPHEARMLAQRALTRFHEGFTVSHMVGAYQSIFSGVAAEASPALATPLVNKLPNM